MNRARIGPALVMPLIVGLAAACGFAQQQAGVDYPGVLPADSAVLFGAGLVSRESFEHSTPTFCPDGTTMLWSIVELPSWKARILESVYEDGTWRAPRYPPFCDTTASEIGPSFSPNGKLLYFSSGRMLPSGKFPLKGNKLWVVERKESGWGEPVPLDSVVTSGGDYSPTVAANGNLYFTHGPFRSPDWNIMVAVDAIANGAAALVRGDVNSGGYEDGPFVAPDERYLIFESNRAGGVDGSIDLYISFRSPDGSWLTPINMGSAINTGAAERFARLSPDRKFLFFGSDRRVLNGKRNFDIYWIRASIIDEFAAQSGQKGQGN